MGHNNRTRVVQVVAVAAMATLVLALSAQASTVPSRPAWCPQIKTERTANAVPTLDAVADKLMRRRPLTIVAIGSSSTEGSDLPDKTLAYPTHLERQLGARLGGSLVTVINKGRGGETMIDTVARFGADVVALKPDLVIWQLGVNDIVRNHDMTVSERTIEDGMVQLVASGTPVILMDMQLAPRVSEAANLPAMQLLLKAQAAKHGAGLWSRFSLMSDIVQTGNATLDELIKPDRLHMTVAMHVCTGAALADSIAQRVAPPAGIATAPR